MTFVPGGLYRQEMIQALEVNGRNWRISYSSASLASVCAAVAAGLGISLLPRRVLQAGHRLLAADSGLPPIAGMHLVLYGRQGLGKAGQDLQAQLYRLCRDQASG